MLVLVAGANSGGVEGGGMIRGWVPVRWDNRARCWQVVGAATTFDRAMARAGALSRRWITAIRPHHPVNGRKEQHESAVRG